MSEFVSVDSGANFMRSGGNSGRWATERFMEAIQNGQPLTSSLLDMGKLTP